MSRYTPLAIMQRQLKPDNDGLYRIRVEEKKPTSIGVALAGLLLFFVNTAIDQSKETRA